MIIGATGVTSAAPWISVSEDVWKGVNLSKGSVGYWKYVKDAVLVIIIHPLIEENVWG